MAKPTTDKATTTKKALLGAKTLAQFILLAAIVVVFLFAAASVLSRTAGINAEIAEIELQIDQEMSRQRAIEQSANYQHSISFIEDIARRRLNLVYPDEIIFIMID